jgi:nitroreductase
MNFIELCQARYSARNYHNLPIEQEKLDYILQCARLAPSAVNFQPWKLQLITDKKDMERIKQCYKRTWFESVSTCIVIYKNKEQEWVRKQDQKPHGDIDVAIITEHICLAAAEQGLGTCWVCNFDSAELFNQFEIPEYLEPVVIIPIGYPADESKEKQRKPMDELMIKLAKK